MYSHPLTLSYRLLRSPLCILFILALVAGVTLSVRPAAASPSATTFTVDSNLDSVSVAAPDGICNDGAGHCTLREALKEANAVSGSANPVTINFSINNTTISLILGTLAVGNYTTINGPATGAITLDAAGNPVSTDTFLMGNPSSTITHLTIRNARRDAIQVVAATISLDYLNIAGSVRYGLYLNYASDIAVSHSSFGSTAYPPANCGAGQGSQMGIVFQGSSYNIAIHTSYIVCNSNTGINLSGGSAVHNVTIDSSYIGTNASGTDLGNALSGIRDNGSDQATISGNVISGNGQNGIYLDSTTHALITGNKIGLTPNGSAALANFDGIYLTNSANHNTIGSDTDPAARNYISGNTANGVELLGGANNNHISGNTIGLGGDNTTTIPNGDYGIKISGGAHDNTFGYDGGNSFIPQLIAGNLAGGILVTGSDGNAFYDSNCVGEGMLNCGAGIGNHGAGVTVVDSSNTIVKGRNNGNTGKGIVITGNTSINNFIVPFAIDNNGGIPVDLGDDGFTKNGAHSGPPGPNNWLPYPTITGLTGSTLTGTTFSSCTVFLFESTGDPALPGGGGIHFDQATANAAGAWTYDLPGGIYGGELTLIACTGATSGSCSEMSPNPSFYMPIVRK